MSIARKTGLIAGAICAATTLANTAEGGEGGHGRAVYAPYYVAAPPVIYYPPTVIYARPRAIEYVPAYPVYAVPAYPSPGVNLNFNIPLR